MEAVFAGANATSANLDAFHDLSSMEAFQNSFVMILVTEIGDKTFFIAALLAMKHAGCRREVFLGAFTALAAMTVLSAGIGLVLPALLSPVVTHWAAVVLFLYFGSTQLFAAMRLLRSGEGGPSGELEEVAQELKDGHAKKTGHTAAFSSVALQALVMTFVAEWGDKSQLGTIALATAKEPLGVTLGGVVGHSCCTGLAVLGGTVLAARISERVVLAAAGVLFLIFAIHNAVTGP